MPSVLIVDDLVSLHEMLGTVVQHSGFTSGFATDGEMALTRYKAEHYDLVLADIDMKPMGGIALLQKLKEYDSNAVVIIMTAYASTESALRALKLGAFDYLCKPFGLDELLATLQRSLAFGKANRARTVAKGPDSSPATIEELIIGGSPPMTKLIAHVRKLAKGRTPVLLMGEKGTGKTLIAEILHRSSGAPDANFVRIDCALSSEENFREGMFGLNAAGGPWIRQAHEGTLLLQHLPCLSLPLQRQLVEVLRQNSHRFRLVCTASEDLERLVEAGTFHDELFYRVGSLPIQLPPLRARGGDIALLARHFAAHGTNPAFDARLIEFTDAALAVLGFHPWPGNVAELQQVVSTIAATTETRVITPLHLPLRLRELGQWPELAEYLAIREQQYVERVLQACHGVKATAARVLGVDASKLA